MLVYWLIFAVFSAGAYSNASSISRTGLATSAGPGFAAVSKRSVILVAASVALVLLIGLRFDVGGDWENYLDLFRRLSLMDLDQAVFGSKQEAGYTFLNWLASRLGAGIWLVNLVCAVPFTYGLFRLCRQQPNPWLALLIATPFLIIVVGMGYTRQAAAMGCLMVGLADLVEKRGRARFIIWAIIGAFFHRTTLVFIPIMLTTGEKNKFVSWLLVIGTLVIAYFTVLPSAFDRYSTGYVREQYSAAGAPVRVLMDVVPALIVLLSRGRFYWSPEEKQVWRTYALLSLLAGAALPFIRSSVIVDRLAIYLIPMQIFAYARIGYCFGLVRRGWLMWTSAVILYSAAGLYVWLNYAVNAFAWLPYRNYLTAPGAY